MITLVEGLPKGKTADIIGRQLLRSATSVGAHYRAACRARSQADFISKIGVAEEEVDESAYWLGLLCEGQVIKHDRIASLLKEANELTAIFSASEKTARERRSWRQHQAVCSV